MIAAHGSKFTRLRFKLHSKHLPATTAKLQRERLKAGIAKLSIPQTQGLAVQPISTYENQTGAAMANFRISGTMKVATRIRNSCHVAHWVSAIVGAKFPTRSGVLLSWPP
jgi:hypothetical protein